MKLTRTLRAILIALVVAVSLSASAGTAWADPVGLPMDKPLIERFGISWDDAP